MVIKAPVEESSEVVSSSVTPSASESADSGAPSATSSQQLCSCGHCLVPSLQAILDILDRVKIAVRGVFDLGCQASGEPRRWWALRPPCLWEEPSTPAVDVSLSSCVRIEVPLFSRGRLGASQLEFLPELLVGLFHFNVCVSSCLFPLHVCKTRAGGPKDGPGLARRMPESPGKLGARKLVRPGLAIERGLNHAPPTRLQVGSSELQRRPPKLVGWPLQQAVRKQPEKIDAALAQIGDSLL